MAKLFYL